MCCHALRQFAEEHPNLDQKWFKKSNYLVLLTVANEKSLYDLILKAKNKINLAIFREPDIENEIASVAFEPGLESKKLCKKLQLLK